MKSNKYWRGSVFVFISVLCFIGCGKAKDTNAVPSSAIAEEEKTEEEMYAESMKDAMIADTDEIEPVISIQKDSEDVIWSEDEETVLMLTYHSDPNSYEEGNDVALRGEVWVTSMEEAVNWYEENKDGVEDWSLRFNQLLGLPVDSNYTALSAIWVKPDDMFRPAYVSDITDTNMRCDFDSNMDKNYKAWFDGNIIFSYYDDAYPWTRLGYTYDWFDNGTDKGLSEFVVNVDSSIKVEFTKSVDEFVNWADSLKDNWESAL